MNTTHTPGPWAIQGQWSVETPRGAMLAECIETPRGGIIGAWIGCGESDCYENARIAAAAPELLDALRGLTDWCREHTSPVQENTPHDLIVAAMRAIAKAEGRN